MAYTFNGSTQALQVAGGLGNYGVAAYPFTQYGMAKSSDLVNTAIFFAFMQDSGTFNGLYLETAGTIAGDPLAVNTFGGAGVVSTVSYADGVWHSLSQRRTSNTVFDANADNTVTVGPTTNVPFATSPGPSAYQIGARFQPGIANALNGSAAKCAMWGVVLTDRECRALNAGFSPRRVRPQSLGVYSPIVRDLQLWARVGTARHIVLTNTAGATVSRHPRSYGF